MQSDPLPFGQSQCSGLLATANSENPQSHEGMYDLFFDDAMAILPCTGDFILPVQPTCNPLPWDPLQDEVITLFGQHSQGAALLPSTIIHSEALQSHGGKPPYT